MLTKKELIIGKNYKSPGGELIGNVTNIQPKGTNHTIDLKTD